MAEAQVPGRFRVDSSATVRELIEELGVRDRVTAFDIAGALFRRHPEYGAGTAGSVSLPTANGPARPMSEWIARVQKIASETLSRSYGLLDGRALILLLSTIDPRLFRVLDDQHLLGAVEREIRADNRDPQDLWNPAGLEQWNRLRRGGDGADDPSLSEAAQASEAAQGLDPTAPDTDETVRDRLSSRVGTHADNPAVFDELSRRPFAEALARRIRDVRRERVRGERYLRGGRESGPELDEVPGKAFLVHIYAPWGAGKTSVLNFLRDALMGTSTGSARGTSTSSPGGTSTSSPGGTSASSPGGTSKASPSGASTSSPTMEEEPWLVVDFNAWRNQRSRPPWYSLVRAIHGQTLEQIRGLDRRRYLVLWLRGLHWRYSFDGAAWVITLILIFLGLMLLSRMNANTGDGVVGFLRRAVAEGEAVWTWGAAALALIGGLASVIKGLLLSWPKTAQIYLESRKDPLKRLVSVFRRYLLALGRPVAVFIDDLDRCDDEYVVELLQGIQTLFHESHIVYVVAADRAWICECFEHRYEGFRMAIGHPGKPIGHLFLEKIFQISVGLPTVSTEDLQQYWEGLVRAGQSGSPAARDPEEVMSEARRRLEGHNEYASIQREMSLSPSSDGASTAALRAVAAEKLSSPSAMAETESFLLRFTHLVEPNPRAMKRLVNAFGMAQAVAILSGREVPEEQLALWTILEMRWPCLADWLSEDVSRVDQFRYQDLVLPPGLASLRTDSEVQAVIEGRGIGVGVGLDAQAVQGIVGRVLVNP